MTETRYKIEPFRSAAGNNWYGIYYSVRLGKFHLYWKRIDYWASIDECMLTMRNHIVRNTKIPGATMLFDERGNRIT